MVNIYSYRQPELIKPLFDRFTMETGIEVPIARRQSVFLRELLEMRYLWEQPLRLDNARLLDTLGAEPHTPLDTAVERLSGVIGEQLAR